MSRNVAYTCIVMERRIGVEARVAACRSDLGMGLREGAPKPRIWDVTPNRHMPLVFAYYYLTFPNSIEVCHISCPTITSCFIVIFLF
uniref:Uncharacterized protein n=1 Tax=Oryza meridionalis TaxID=40149 RepID=A0A0E0E2J0_9ORYZ